MEIIRHALDEDVGASDITSAALFPASKTVQAVILAKEEGILAGITIAMAAFVMRDSKIKFMPLKMDGQWVEPEQQISYIEGDCKAILSAERTALNFISLLSGIATLTAKYIEAVKPYKARIMDTRKTTPGLRLLEKYAVSVGGGINHRMGLFDQVLIKDNHLAACGYDWVSVRETIRKAKEKGIKTEIEADTLDDFRQAMDCEADVIMLDNMGLKQIEEAVALRDSGHPGLKLEVSGGVNLRNVRKIAAAGVDMISVGALTHSVKAIDFSLEIVRRDGS